eukprot:1584886-Rhodomonas_salina.3
MESDSCHRPPQHKANCCPGPAPPEHTARPHPRRRPRTSPRRSPRHTGRGSPLTTSPHQYRCHQYQN